MLRCLWIAALVGASVFFLSSPVVDAASAGRAPARPVIAEPSLTSKDTKKRVMDHPAFATAGTKKGVEIWRIENFEPVVVPRGENGKFFSGDSYIILNTKEDNRKHLSWDLHYWLGSKTSQDESGSAAILTVALDDKLGGGPVQHREVQGHESPLFLGYFKPAIRYLDGGHATGFTHVTTNAGAEKRMFQVKGKKNIRVRQVEPSVAAMNKGDCFILDVGHDIYVYVGPNAKRVERLKAISAANQIRDQDHAGRARIDIIDEFSSEHDFEKFFGALGSGTKDSVPEESAGGDDQAFERTEESSVSLYRITDESGKLESKPIAQKPFRQDHLNENDCFLLDTVTGGLYVWVGKKCNDRERTEVMSKAQQYLNSKNYPAWVHITKIPQGTEPAAFKQYFSTWRDHGASHSRLIRSASDEEMYSSDVDVSESKIKSVAKTGSARGFMPDLGEGEVKVFRVENTKLVEDEDCSDRDGSRFGQFYQGDSYVVRYTYTTDEGKTGTISYFWMGKFSSFEEMTTAVAQTNTDNDFDTNGNADIIVPQGYEPKHFLAIFKGHFITHLGDYTTVPGDGNRLYKVEGSDDIDTRAQQVSAKGSNLEEDNAFLLITPSQTFAWIGRDSSDVEKTSVYNFAKLIMGEEKDVTTVEQGDEPSEFWDALGGAPVSVKKSVSATQKRRLRVGREPHLLQIAVNSRNKVKLQDIGGFTQQDLDDDDVFLLDSGEEIYAWIGNQATRNERDSVQTAITEYLKTDPSDRTPKSVVVIFVKQGHEPKIFTRLFGDWDADMWQKQISYDAIKSKMIEENDIM